MAIYWAAKISSAEETWKEALPAKLLPPVSRVARINGRRVLMDTLALVLTASVFNQRVINRTGLSGEFDLDLRFTPESSSAPAPEFPSIFTAVQEQLGLRLQSERGPVPVLVIDSIQRPNPD